MELTIIYITAFSFQKLFMASVLLLHSGSLGALVEFYSIILRGGTCMSIEHVLLGYAPYFKQYLGTSYTKFGLTSAEDRKRLERFFVWSSESWLFPDEFAEFVKDG